jgi:hypothetical protein
MRKSTGVKEHNGAQVNEILGSIPPEVRRLLRTTLNLYQFFVKLQNKVTPLSAVVLDCF